MREMFSVLGKGKMIMFPQNFYCEAYYLDEGPDGHDIMYAYPSKKEADPVVMELVTIGDILWWETDKKRFPSDTVAAFSEYYADDHIKYKGPALTSEVHNDCGERAVLRIVDGVERRYCICCDKHLEDEDVTSLASNPFAIVKDYTSRDAAMFNIYNTNKLDDPVLMLSVELLADKNETAYVEIYAEYNDLAGMISESIVLGEEWDEKMDVTSTVDSEYLNIWVNAGDSHYGVQVKVEEEGAVFDVIKEKNGKEEEICGLGWRSNEDLGWS